MTLTRNFEELIGKRIRLVQMYNDPDPIQPGQEGTVYHFGYGVLSVKWDNGRTLGLVVELDEFEVIDE